MFGQARIGETGTDWVFTGSMRFPATCCAIFDCGTALQERDELEVVGSEGSFFLDDPFPRLHPGDRKSARRTRRADRSRFLPARARDPSGVSAREAEPLLGREDALGQARALEALHRSA